MSKDFGLSENFYLESLKIPTQFNVSSSQRRNETTDLSKPSATLSAADKTVFVNGSDFFGYNINTAARPVLREDVNLRKSEKKPKKSRKEKRGSAEIEI